MASVRKREWTTNEEVKTAWVCEYTDQGGKRRRKTFDKKKDADKFRTQVEVEIEKGEHTPNSESLAIGAICEAYIRHCEQRMRDKSLSRGRYVNIKKAIDNYIIPYFSQKLITEIKWKDIEDWYGWVLAKGRLGSRTLVKYMEVFKLVEGYAIKRGYTKRNVIGPACREFKPAPAKPIRTFNAEEIARLLTAVASRVKGRRERPAVLLRVVVHLAAFCGLRYGEIMGLTLANIDLEKRLIKVRHSLTEWGELKGPKTRAGIRDVPMPAHIVDLMREWIDLHYVENEKEIALRSEHGKMIGNTNFHICYWKPLLERSGLGKEVVGEHIHFHALRHFAASWMIEHNLPLTEVASLLGHSSFDETLQTYAHPIVGGNRRHEAMDAMARNLLSPPSPTRQECDIGA